MNADLGRGTPDRDPPFLPPLPSSGGAPEGTHGLFFGPHGVRAGWRAAMYLALFALFLSGIQMLAAPFHIGVPVAGVQPEPNAMLLWEFVSLLCAMAATLVMARLEGGRFDDYGMPLKGALRSRFWKGAAWGVAQITVLILAIAALGGYSFGVRAIDFVNMIRLGLYYALFFMIVGVFEEFFFRGYLQHTLASGMTFWPAAILVSLGFAAAHLNNSGESLAGIPDLVAISLFFCLTLRRTGDLWFAIGFHAAFDFGESYLYSVPDSGFVTPGHLTYASLHGPDWLTGGVVGPEGSVISVVLIVLTFVLFERVYRPLPQTHPVLQGQLEPTAPPPQEAVPPETIPPPPE